MKIMMKSPKPLTVRETKSPRNYPSASNLPNIERILCLTGYLGISRLQDVSDEAEDGSETSTGGGEGLVGSTGEGGDRSSVCTSASRSGSVSWGWGASIDIGSAVGWGSNARIDGSNAGVNGSAGVDDWDRGAGARSDDSGADGLGDRAWAVGDGQGGGLSDGVGDTTVGDLSGLRAVGLVGSHNLSRVDWELGIVAPGIGTSDKGGGSSDGSGETHFDGINYLRW